MNGIKKGRINVSRKEERSLGEKGGLKKIKWNEKPKAKSRGGGGEMRGKEGGAWKMDRGKKFNITRRNKNEKVNC